MRVTVENDKVLRFGVSQPGNILFGIYAMPSGLDAAASRSGGIDAASPDEIVHP